eukprot:6187280-Pleurochrysis_carterae.AAC.1
MVLKLSHQVAAYFARNFAASSSDGCKLRHFDPNEHIPERNGMHTCMCTGQGKLTVDGCVSMLDCAESANEKCAQAIAGAEGLRVAHLLSLRHFIARRRVPVHASFARACMSVLTERHTSARFAAHGSEMTQALRLWVREGNHVSFSELHLKLDGQTMEDAARWKWVWLRP